MKNKLFFVLGKAGGPYRFPILLIFFAIIPFMPYGNLVTRFTNFEYFSQNTFYTIWSPLHLGSFSFYLVITDYFVYLLSLIISSSIAVKLFFMFCVTVAALSMFNLLKKLVGNEYISFIGSLFYIYGIYGQFVSSWPENTVFALLPLCTLCLVSITESSDELLSSIILSLLLFLLTGQNLTYILYFLGWIVLFGCYRFFVTKNQVIKKKLAITLILSIVFSLLLSSYFYFAQFSQYFYQNSLLTGSLSLESPEWKSSTSWMYELLREMGSVNYYYYFFGYSYPNARPFVTNPFLMFISYLFSLATIASILLFRQREKNKKYLTMWLTGALIFLLFMASGVFKYAITKPLYYLLYSHIHFFSIFRDAYKPMLFIHFIYALLIALFLRDLYLFKKKLFLVISSLFLMAILIISYQYWDGTFLNQDLIKIPQYWNDIAKYYRLSGKNRQILLFPDSPMLAYTFTHQRGENTDFFRPYFSNNLLYRAGGSVYDDNLVNTIYTAIYKNPSCFTNLPGFLGVSYILNQHDADYPLYQRKDKHIATPDEVDQALHSSTNFSLLKTFGKLNLYQVSPTTVYDKFYIPEIIYQSPSQSICQLAVKSTGKDTIASAPAVKGNVIISQQSKVYATQHSNALYTLSLSPSTQKFLVVFNQRYDTGWKLFTGDNSSISSLLFLPFKQPFLDYSHVIANTFANGWWIAPENQSVQLTLVYMPQLFFYWGVILTVFFLLLFGSIVVYKIVKRGDKK